MLMKLALLTMVVCAVQGNTVNRLLASIGTDANDANTCLLTLFTGHCQREIKPSQQEAYYCCVLWDELDCFKAHYKADCTPADAAELEKDWATIQLTIAGQVYSEPSCTADHYGVDADCTPADAAELEKDWATIQLTIAGQVYSEPSCTADHYGVDVSRD
ncbi:unnamed protein product, partial [Medioppia subpectinata]